MLVVRDIFQLKFGKAKEAKALTLDAIKIMKKYNPASVRFLTDFTGKSYRLILETSYSNLAEYEESLNSTLGAEEWRPWYEKFIPLVESSEREILREVK
jgi:hypothetical protein